MKTIIKLYNSYSKSVEDFKPVKDGRVGVYSCGPTVYDVAHIGNLRAYVFDDLLYRFLKSQEYSVKWVMNITDIDDKTLKRARDEGKSLKEVTDKYIDKFLDDLRAINLAVDEIKFVRATDHLGEMKELADKLVEKGFAYKTADGIYFDVSKFKNYGKFAGVEVDPAKAQSRIANDAYDKESVQDFALWKNDSDFPDGRPGWHIECSAMSAKYLGQPFDIHTGGVDLIFPHHTNEIAQSEAAEGKPLANYWLHNEHLLVEGRKMAKSEGNFYTLQDVEDKGFSPMALRLELLKAHYRSKLDFSWKSLEASQSLLIDWRRFYVLSKSEKSEDPNNSKRLAEMYDDFINHLSNDLMAPKAISIINSVVNNPKSQGSAGRDFMQKVDEVLGLEVAVDTPQEIEQITKEMDSARESGDYKKSDELRNSIENMGYVVENSPDGSYAIMK